MKQFIQTLLNPANLRRRLTVAYTAVTVGVLLIALLIFLVLDNGGFSDIGELSFIFIVMSIAITVVITILGTFFGIIASRTLVQRVRRLDEAATAWAAGEFMLQVEDDGNDEIGRLSRKLNSMARQLDTLVNERVDLVREVALLNARKKN